TRSIICFISMYTDLLQLATLARDPLDAPQPMVFWSLCVGALLLAGFFAVLRECLEQCSPVHVLEQLKRGTNDKRRANLAKLLERSERMTTCAGVLEVLFTLAFIACFFVAIGFDGTTASTSSGTMIAAAALVVPTVLIVTRILPLAVHRSRGDSLLAKVLPSFGYLDLALLPIVWPLDLMRRLVLRLFGLREETSTTRILVEDLRDVIEDSDMARGLPESGLELIENVMEFHDVDVAAVMTPRTELSAIAVTATAEELVRAIAESGHSRLAVYEESLDTIIGWITARDVIRLVDRGNLDELKLRTFLRPPQFVPETKLIADMLRDFQSERYKLAFVLDEYGGTAGIVTLGDVLEELVGEMHDEYDRDEEAAIQSLPSGAFDVLASEHVSEVNEVIGLEIPEEEDFETLAGFVLGHFGRFPDEGERFEELGAEFHVTEANDRRVLRVRVTPGDAIETTPSTKPAPRD
ncbi:MAG: putative hemolysin, partial [Bacteroidia bacterium]